MPVTLPGEVQVEEGADPDDGDRRRDPPESLNQEPAVAQDEVGLRPHDLPCQIIQGHGAGGGPALDCDAPALDMAEIAKTAEQRIPFGITAFRKVLSC